MILQGRPIGEPVVQHGPFVMNTDRELMQAVDDYNNGLMGILHEVFEFVLLHKNYCEQNYIRLFWILIKTLLNI